MTDTTTGITPPQAHARLLVTTTEEIYVDVDQGTADRGPEPDRLPRCLQIRRPRLSHRTTNEPWGLTA